MRFTVCIQCSQQLDDLNCYRLRCPLPPWQTFLRDAAREAEFWSDSHQFVAMAKRKAIDDYGLHSYRKVHPAASLRCLDFC